MDYAHCTGHGTRSGKEPLRFMLILLSDRDRDREQGQTDRFSSHFTTGSCIWKKCFHITFILFSCSPYHFLQLQCEWSTLFPFPAHFLYPASPCPCPCPLLVPVHVHSLSLFSPCSCPVPVPTQSLSLPIPYPCPCQVPVPVPVPIPCSVNKP